MRKYPDIYNSMIRCPHCDWCQGNSTLRIKKKVLGRQEDVEQKTRCGGCGKKFWVFARLTVEFSSIPTNDKTEIE